ncbi:MAG: glycine--tRNA ligase subunit beta [Rhizomicrobium sp.]
MSDLLLELFSEEIPARMQAQAAKDLERLVVGALADRGLLFEGAKAFAGPRRLTLAVSGLPAKQPDVSEEKKGPRVNAPAKAIEGFLRSAGVTLADCEQRDDGKGPFYVAVIGLKGRATADVIAEFLPDVLAKLPWPKSMRWPQATNAPVRWVRPLHSILCTLDGEVVEFAFAGVTADVTTRGHRFLSSGVIAAKRFDDYVAKLRAAHVILDAEERKAIIFEAVKQAAFIHGLEMIPDEGLLNEVAGLAEWPVVLLGTIENQFMDVPAEILQTTMRVHQKYFALRDPATGKMANRFALVANMVAEDGGKQIIAGNERVLRARLSDAKFFWDQDRKVKLADRVAALGDIVFHAKLGTQLERVERIEALARKIGAQIGGDIAENAGRAARLAKADLTTGVVGEFPELQGTMGRYYALHDHEDADVADAIRDHYKPVGPSDIVPVSRVSWAVALSDKLDTLYGMFANGERPTGSGDPYALRRAALGVIRILLEKDLRFSLNELCGWAAQGYGDGDEAVISDLVTFFAERLKVVQRAKGMRHDLIDAVFSLGNEDELVRIVSRVEALQAFLKTDDGANLLAGYKRATNILKAEEKKDGVVFDGAFDFALLSEPAEKVLADTLGLTQVAIAPSLETEAFAVAMTVMAGLRTPVDAFFEKVKVNADDRAVRANRLNLLGALRATLHQVADFSKIEG